MISYYLLKWDVIGVGVYEEQRKKKNVCGKVGRNQKESFAE